MSCHKPCSRIGLDLGEERLENKFRAGIQTHYQFASMDFHAGRRSDIANIKQTLLSRSG